MSLRTNIHMYMSYATNRIQCATFQLQIDYYAVYQLVLVPPVPIKDFLVCDCLIKVQFVGKVRCAESMWMEVRK